MSGTIHVNTDLMRLLGRRFLEISEYCQTQLITELQNISAQIEGDWIGVSRQRYDELFQQWRQSSQSLLTWGQEIGQHLNNTANQFDNADQS
jgi:WXG100 family type VII secretion target